MLNKNKISNWKPMLVGYTTLALVFLVFSTVLTHEASAKIYINGSNSGDSYNMEIPDAESGASYIFYKPWYSIITGTVNAKNGSTGKIDFSSTNASTVWMNSLANNPKKIIIKDDMNLPSNITITKGVNIEGFISTVSDEMSPTLTYTGDPVDSMFYIADTADGTQLRNLLIDGNLLVNNTIYFHSDTGTAIHTARMDNVNIKGYNHSGLVLGVDNNVTLAAGQFSEFTGDRLWFEGGLNNATGITINAQNGEWIIFRGLRFDPPNAANKNHLNHINMRSGALDISGLVSTRANSYAIKSSGQMIINGWRSEDEFLLSGVSASYEGPQVINSLLHRPPFGGNSTINFMGFGNESALNINGAFIDGNITLGATDPRYFSFNGVYFKHGWERYVFSGPKNQFGTIISNGSVNNYIRGSLSRNCGVADVASGGSIVHGLAEKPTVWWMFSQATNVSVAGNATSGSLKPNMTYVNNATVVTVAVPVMWCAEITQ